MKTVIQLLTCLSFLFPSVTMANVERIKESVSKTEIKLGIPSGLLHAIIQVESGFNIRAINSPLNPGVAVSSFGLGQITAGSGQFHCGYTSDELLDPYKNIRCSGKILKYYLDFHNDVDRAIAAYNWGTPCECDGGFYKKVWNGKVQMCTKRSSKTIRCVNGRFFNQKYVNSVNREWKTLLNGSS